MSTSDVSGPGGPTSSGRVGRLARGVLHAPLPAPPEVLRRGPFRAGAFPSTLRSEQVTAWVGLALGISFGVCLLTGLVSHGIQQPPSWFWWPSRPVNLYRVSQGVHVATGFATVPLLLVKLWSVYPRLFSWPPARDLTHAVERAAVLLLIAGALLQVATGVMNTAQWYAFGFSFPTAHFWTAWITIGALLLHIGAKSVQIRRGLRRGPPAGAATGPAAARPGDHHAVTRHDVINSGSASGATASPVPASELDPAAAPGGTPGPQPLLEPAPAPVGGLSRRGLLVATAAAVGVVTVATVGQTVAPLAPFSPLAPRRPEVGPQGLPVNKTAGAAGVLDTARDPAYRLVVAGPRELTLSLADLRALPQRTVTLPITCVEGWSASAEWTGVRLGDLLRLAGAEPGDEVQVRSLQESGSYSSSVVAGPHSRDPLTLLALRVNGAELDLDHGFPCRLIAPNRPGVLQTKWVSRLEIR